MKRLFRVFNVKTKKFEKQFFEKKKDAKKVRDELNKTKNDFVINRGPDHILGPTKGK